MKSYEKMANDLFKRRDEYLAKKAKIRNNVIKSVSSVLCVMLVCVGGIGVYRALGTDTPVVSEKNEGVMWADTVKISFYGTIDDAEAGMNIGGFELRDRFSKLDDDQELAVCIFGFEKMFDEFGAKDLEEPDTGYLRTYQSIYTLTKWREENVEPVLNEGKDIEKVLKDDLLIEYYLSVYSKDWGIRDRYVELTEKYAEHAKLYREFLESHGLNVLHDASEADWGLFLNGIESGNGSINNSVVLTTVKELKELDALAKEKGDSFTVMLAPKEPEEALKHYYFDYLMYYVPSGGYARLKGNDVMLKNYTGDIDAYYQLVLAENKANAEGGSAVDVDKYGADVLWAETKDVTKGDFGYDLSGENTSIQIVGYPLQKIFNDLDENQKIAVCISDYSIAFTRYYYKKSEHMAWTGARESGKFAYWFNGPIDIMYNNRALLMEGKKLEELVTLEEVEKFMALYDAENGLKAMDDTKTRLYKGTGEAAQRYFETKFGVEVIANSADSIWGPYLNKFFDAPYSVYGSCVIITTKNELREIAKTAKELGASIRVALAPKDPVVAVKSLWFQSFWDVEDYGVGRLDFEGDYSLVFRKYELENYNGNVDEFYQYLLDNRK